jgi:hypothetical protein
MIQGIQGNLLGKEHVGDAIADEFLGIGPSPVQQTGVEERFILAWSTRFPNWAF